MAEKGKSPCVLSSSNERWLKSPKPPAVIRKVHGSYMPFKLAALLIGVPLILANTFTLMYFTKEKERPPFVQYSYLRIRNKKFPWGDGDHSFFHNPKMNATSKGYDDQVQESEE